MKSIYSLSLEDFENYFLSINEKKFRAKQVYDWLYVKRVNNFDLMSNINKEVLSKLKEDFFFDEIKIVKKETSEDVNKYLFELSDKEYIEAVLMNHNYGNSLCISTQVGCNMNCSFCESGRLKKVRNLTPNEMILQVLSVEKDINKRISHIVVMGIGEPFDNYDNFAKFIEIINSPFGISLGSRHITVSTCGIVPRIRDFANFKYQVNLAISLHAPNDELRTKLMPINKAYPINELMSAIKYYLDKTNRRVTFEYIMIDQVNDSEKEAIELSKLLKGINCYVNLIPYNETNHNMYRRSKMEKIMAFYDILKKNKINVTIRREFGSNVSAACGQLRSKKEDM